MFLKNSIKFIYYYYYFICLQPIYYMNTNICSEGKTAENLTSILDIDGCESISNVLNTQHLLSVTLQRKNAGTTK